MASAKVMAKLQADQNSITQMAELHSKQGSNVSNSSLAKKASLAAQRWHHSVLASQASHKVISLNKELLTWIYLLILYCLSKSPPSRDENGIISI
jgi:hypothetical protein